MIELNPKINSYQLRTLSAIKRCRTIELGRHTDACTDCGTLRISYNSCRNRHCPRCQGKNREDWIEKRKNELLPVPYFHVVFTLPDLINQTAMYKPKEVFNTLFETAWETMQEFAWDKKHLGAKTGMICILHTWGQTMGLHPHLHCIVPGGGLSLHGKWKTARSKGKFLFPVKAMSPVFRGKYMEALKLKLPDIDKKLIDDLYEKKWVVYAKRAFGNPENVVEYLGRYTHKIAISNNRITNIADNSVSFTYKDYRQGGKKLEMTLDAMEFIRRFSLHILPRGFTRIRHFGILSSTSKKECIPIIKHQLPEIPVIKVKTRNCKPYNPKLCPCCKTETMVTIEIHTKRGPPNIFPKLIALKRENKEN